MDSSQLGTVSNLKKSQEGNEKPLWLGTREGPDEGRAGTEAGGRGIISPPQVWPRDFQKRHRGGQNFNVLRLTGARGGPEAGTQIHRLLGA